MEFRLCNACHKLHAGQTSCPACGGRLTLVDEAFFLGQDFGKYRVESVLGLGGMGVVYLARHTTLGRQAAVKVLAASSLGNPHAMKRFLVEAQVLAELKHPAIVEVYDFDVNEWGAPYYVMEYLQGRNLREVLRAPGASRELSDYRSLIRDAARGLAYAHRRGVIHRDLKPENILVEWVDDRARAKILDFGVAKLLHEAPADLTLTAAGMVAGTPLYLAPEQILGQPLGPAVDQFALALILAEIPLGHPLRKGMAFSEILSRVARQESAAEHLEWPPLPPGLDKALRRATDPDPARRHEDVLAFVQALGFPESEAEGRDFLAGGLPEEGPAALSPPAGTHAPHATPSRPPLGAVLERMGAGTSSSGQRPLPGSMTSTMEGERPHPSSTGSGLQDAGTVDLRLAGTSAPARSTPAPTRLWRRLALGAGACLLLAGAAAGGYQIWQRSRIGAVGRALLEPLASLAVPGDAVEIQGQGDANLLLNGQGCLYVQALDPSIPVARIPLGAEEALLGTHGNGWVFVQRGAAIEVRGLGTDGRTHPWAKPVPEGRVLALGEDGQWLALQQEGALVLAEREGTAWTPRHRLPVAELAALRTGRPALVLGRRHVAFLSGGRLHIHRLSDASEILSAPFEDPGTNAMALEDVRGWVALGGWSNQVQVFDPGKPGPPIAVPRPLQTKALRFLPDAPTLAIAGEGGLQLWRAGEGLVARWEDPKSDLRSLHFGPHGLITLDAHGSQLRRFAYRGCDLARAFPVTPKEVWSLAVDPSGRRLYAGGGSNGEIHGLDPTTGQVTVHPLHSQGITALATDGLHLASASDDKSIAVLGLPALNVVWRSQAHQFLVNHLALQGQPPALWSASSDGSVKRWAWPGLEPTLELDTRALLGRRISCQSLWIAPDQNTLLVGTWEPSLLVCRRKEQAWEIRTLPVASQTIYSMADLPDVQAVLVVGTHFPSRLYVYDLKRDRLDPLVHPSGSYVWALPEPDGRGAVILGIATALRLRFQREKDGSLACASQASLNTDLGYLMCGVRMPGRDLLAAGEGRGRVLLFPPPPFAKDRAWKERIP